MGNNVISKKEGGRGAGEIMVTAHSKMYLTSVLLSYNSPIQPWLMRKTPP